MFRIMDAKTGSLITNELNPVWVKQQDGVDFPILCNDFSDADGIVLDNGRKMVGISGREMDNYEPLVTVKEVSGEAILFTEIQRIKSKVDEVYTNQTNESVSTQELNTAYQKGVNSIE